MKQDILEVLFTEEQLREKAGKEKIAFNPPAVIPELEAKVHAVAEEGLKAAFAIKDKLPRREARRAVKQAVMEAVVAAFPDQPLYKMKAADILEAMEKKLLRALIMGETIRPRPCTHHEDLLRNVSGLCNNANQLAHQANSTGRAEQKSVEKMIELTRKVYNAVKINW